MVTFRCSSKIVLIILILCLLVSTVIAQQSTISKKGELLYNGIQLPIVWPPDYRQLTREPMRVPYLENPPDVIPIDVGRQLFVDEFLIEQTSLKRTFHTPECHPMNPILTYDKWWEKESSAPMAAPFSDGVWYDPNDKLFKMWYIGGYLLKTCYAVSRDGIHWNKPRLDIVPGTNVVLYNDSIQSKIDEPFRDSGTIWLDHEEWNLDRRFKMFVTRKDANGKWILQLRCSPDGIHWSKPMATSPVIGDRSTVHYNPFRKVWVTGIRIGIDGIGRARAYRENPDVVKCIEGTEQVQWMCADRLDPHNPNPEFGAIPPELYNHDAVAYESIMLGLFSIWQGPSNKTCGERRIQKRNEIFIGFSRDGFHYSRLNRERFIGVNEKPDAWNWGNVQSVGGCCIIVGEKLYFYFSGRALPSSFWDGCASTGLAILRRDGFVSLDAGEQVGTLETRPVLFKGKYLFVNVVTDKGEMRVEVLDKNNQIIEPFTASNCEPISVDKTLYLVKWRYAADLSSLIGKPVKFRFTLKNGSLYSFWVSPETSGASFGYVAGGGPGFKGSIDTVGLKGF